MRFRLINTAAYSFQDGRVRVQVSARYGSVLPVDILHPNVGFQRYHTTVVSPSLSAIGYLDNTLFYARRRTTLYTMTAALLLAVWSCGTVCHLHFD